MNQIHVLDQATIDKIAAGEVVERPASIVKELVENAIDAGASRITIEIKNGGIAMIRITDNGKGIAPDDIPLAFLRHATSKITDITDLDVLSSLGFRGEALSSISAVSKVELITKKADELAAIRYLIEGGREKLSEEIGAPDGTTMIVRDIFYNTPARAKFLKTPLTEASHVGSAVEQLILSNPEIAFTFIVNGQTKLTSGGSGNLLGAIVSIYGRMYRDLLVPIRMETDWISITGYIGKAEASRGNRTYENYYVNGRYVKSRIIAKGIEDGYGTKLMQHQYPFTCMRIMIDGRKVDVNVHPQKMDVRFSDEKQVYDAIRAAVEASLNDVSMIVESSLTSPGKKAKDISPEDHSRVKPLQAFETPSSKPDARAASTANSTVPEKFRDSAEPAYTPGESGIRKVPVAADQISSDDAAGTRTDIADQPPADRNSVSRMTVPDLTAVSASETPEEPDRQTNTSGPNISAPQKEGKWEQQSFIPEFLSKEAKPMRRIVGQVFNTYWICEYDGKMYLFDQHAAHERVLFEKLMHQYADKSISSQMLNPPMIVTLDSKQQGLIEQFGDAFAGLGFEIESFGDRDYAIRSVPYSLGSIRSKDLFLGLLDQLETSDKTEDLELYVHRVATEACKAAVKGGRRISFEEAAKLLDDMMNCADPYHCPHGRPTIISFSKTDLEKRFKRILS